VVCFRRKAGAKADRINEEIMAQVNRSGRVFLSHTKLRGEYAIRMALGNPRTTMDHVRSCWSLLKEAAQSVG
jgi:aromatic-L-amino-acid decarboxylase